MVIVVKSQPVNVEDIRNVDSTPESGRPPGVRNSNPLQYSCLKNSMHKGICQYRVYGARKRKFKMFW